MQGILLQVTIYLAAAVIAVPLVRWLGFGTVLGYLAAGAAIGPALTPADRWVIRRLGRALTEAEAGLAAYRFNEAALALYQFTWNVYCDWYIELAKPALQDPARRAAAQWTLLRVLRDVLKALHPSAPFVTEEEAIRLANDTRYGLAAAVWTQNLARGHRVAQAMQVGLAWVNCWFLRDLRTQIA